jgi:hypothetical protein
LHFFSLHGARTTKIVTAIARSLPTALGLATALGLPTALGLGLPTALDLGLPTALTITLILTFLAGGLDGLADNSRCIGVSDVVAEVSPPVVICDCK